MYAALIPLDLVSCQITKADLEQRHPQLDYVFTLAQNLKNKASSSDVRTAITEKRKLKKNPIYSIEYQPLCLMFTHIFKDYSAGDCYLLIDTLPSGGNSFLSLFSYFESLHIPLF